MTERISLPGVKIRECQVSRSRISGAGVGSGTTRDCKVTPWLFLVKITQQDCAAEVVSLLLWLVPLCQRSSYARVCPSSAQAVKGISKRRSAQIIRTLHIHTHMRTSFQTTAAALTYAGIHP